MPTYAYECSACGHRFEEFQTMSAAVLRKCPACKKSKLQRLIGAGAGVIFKGSGFYQTDYKKSGGDKKGSEGDGKQTASESSKDGGSDGKAGAPKAPATESKPASSDPAQPASKSASKPASKPDKKS